MLFWNCIIFIVVIFYGSSIWDLSSQCVSKLYIAWNTEIRILFNVPRDTHRYLIESISECLHVNALLASWCVSLYKTIEASSKLCIRFLSNLCKYDLNSVLDRNLFSIANDCFVNTRTNNLYVEGFDDYVITEMINMLSNE